MEQSDPVSVFLGAFCALCLAILAVHNSPIAAHIAGNLWALMTGAW
jgi:hypothetical protein